MDEIIKDILKSKEIRKISVQDIEMDLERFNNFRIPKITVHGRFQPPLHCNHFFTYIANAFRIAEKVIILITNPDLDENLVKQANHRSTQENNPFTYEERAEMFKSFFEDLGIAKDRYEFKPFKITDDKNWEKALEKEIPKLVNIYGEWSQVKLDKFRNRGYRVIYSYIPKIKDVSGVEIRDIINSDLTPVEKREKLIEVGYMEEAIQGLFKVIEKSRKIC